MAARRCIYYYQFAFSFLILLLIYYDFEILVLTYYSYHYSYYFEAVCVQISNDICAWDGIAQSAPWSIAHLPAMMRWLCGIGPDRRPVRGGLPGGRRHLDLDRAQARPSSQRSARHPTRFLGGKRMRALFEVNVSAKLKMQSQIVPRQLHEEEPLDLRTPRLVRPWRQRSGGRGV